MSIEEKISKIEEEIEKVTSKLNDPNLCKGTLSTQTRVSGYYRDVNNWNNGKKAEYSSRISYQVF